MMNLEQCEIKQLKQEIAELRAKVDRFKLLLESRMIDPSATLQQIKRDAVLEAVDKVQKKTSATVILGMVRDEANNLVKGGE